ncbi:MAG: YncE family protein [Planctomycetota bacterium]
MVPVVIGSQVERLLREAVRIVATAMVLLFVLPATSSLAAERKVDVEPLDLPPTLPDGKTVETFSSAELLEPPASMRDVAVAKTPPIIDFLYYPGQDYEGKPWSNWGDGVATSARYYSAIGDHKAPDGNAFVYEYNAAAKTLRKIVDLRELLKVPEGQYSPGKIHSRIDVGGDGWLYFSTHRGSTRVTTDEYGYKGDWIIRHNPGTSTTEVVVQGPVGKHCIPCSVLDPDRLIFYGGTAAGDRTDKSILFFAYDIADSRLLYSGQGGPGRYMLFSRSKHRVYFTPGLAGPLFRYDPGRDGRPVKLDVQIGVRAATQETPQGYIYTVSRKDATIYRFNTKTEEVAYVGSAPVGTQTYITTIDADPTGRYLYYVPGAHGGSEKDGSPIVQFDVTAKKKKVIAFLASCLKRKFGYTPLGTFSTAVSPSGEMLYITWNGNLGGLRRGRLTWDACALTVVHIPPSQRPLRDF